MLRPIAGGDFFPSGSEGNLEGDTFMGTVVAKVNDDVSNRVTLGGEVVFIHADALFRLEMSMAELANLFSNAEERTVAGLVAKVFSGPGPYCGLIFA
jgi:hypothetical protein